MSIRLNIYIIHAQWLKEREKIISDFQSVIGKHHFSKLKGVKIRVITDFDPTDISAELIAKTVSYNPIKDEDVPTLQSSDKKPSFYNMFFKNLHVFQLSNALKHYKALEEISKESQPNDINIVLEDDVLYEDKVCVTLEKLISNLPSTYDVVFMGLPSNMDAQNREKSNFQSTKDVFRVLPYCDSYLVSTEAAKKMFENYLPIRFINNIQLSYVLEKLELNSLLSLPNIFMDGSKFGMCLSTLNPNNQLLFNNDYMKSRMIVMSEKPAQQDLIALEALFKESPLNAHPDFMSLKALHFAKTGKYKDAEALFEQTMKIYQANNCILNHESQFLKDYIRLFKNVQNV
jgi:GR25 family glycosyltransferase involved in LPS biosynthesis